MEWKCIQLSLPNGDTINIGVKGDLIRVRGNTYLPLEGKLHPCKDLGGVGLLTLTKGDLREEKVLDIRRNK